MPKNTNAARREAARRLAAEQGISYTAALRRLSSSQVAPSIGTPERTTPEVRKAKKAIRARPAAPGRSSPDAGASVASSDTPPPVLADPLRRALSTALAAAGWPLEIEHHPQAAALRSYAGPAIIDVARAEDPAGGLTGDEHPDDPAVFDLAGPLRVTIWAPMLTDFAPELGRVAGIDAHSVAADQPAGEIVAEIDRLVAAARRRDLGDTPAHGRCGICGDAYPEATLFTPTRAPVAVCPCCAFDGDLIGAHPAWLAYQMDRATTRSVALPAGWSAVQVLLCCLAGSRFGRRLRAEWRENGTLFEPTEAWSDPSQAWIWLPPPPARPAALAGLGCGASLATVIDTLDRAHPDLRARYQARRDRELAEYRADEYGDEDPPQEDEDLLEDEDGLEAPPQVIERFLPAIVAYTVAMLTQQAERPGHRRPWHVLQSFELGDWISVLDPALDSYQVETVLRVGIATVRDLLDPDGGHDD